ncbi:hypothetical protein BpHYR1_047099 [Brachionus plicatilis]|uniref:Uncharacterized protein n=1 Tax=Brachionus plicatilis TaxID=10195 RepID=A0A3M7Q1G3_BRAPC|nr:hypothetical protein BpHYR1_047099 [Brachionus plicatilis]
MRRSTSTPSCLRYCSKTNSVEMQCVPNPQKKSVNGRDGYVYWKGALDHIVVQIVTQGSHLKMAHGHSGKPVRFDQFSTVGRVDPTSRVEKTQNHFQTVHIVLIAQKLIQQKQLTDYIDYEQKLGEQVNKK